MTNLANAPLRPSANTWRTPGEIDLSELAQARIEAINLVQWPARVANSYVEDGVADRSTLTFRPSEAALVTNCFENNIALEIRFPSLEMQFLDHGKPVPHVFDPEAHSPAEVEAWILVELLHRDVERGRFSTRLPYDIPGLLTGDAEDHSPQARRIGLQQLTYLLQDAAAVLQASARADGNDGVAIVCVPQTLDLRATTPGMKSSFAFSPGNAQHPTPYFYVDDEGTRLSRPVVEASALFAERDPVAASGRLKQLASTKLAQV
jgi:hypothetical protein